MRVIRGFEAQGIVACYDEPSNVGDEFDLDAPRNGPAKNPHMHLDKLVWHSDFFQYQLYSEIHTVTISHPSVAGRVQLWGASGGSQFGFIGNVETRSHTLLTHNLGYEPLAFVVADGVTVTSGREVQVNHEFAYRRTVTSFVDSNIVGLHEVGISGFASAASMSEGPLPAMSKTYQVMLFVAPEEDPAKPLFGGESGRVTLDRGRIDSDYLYARQVSMLESYFSLDLGRTIDISGGGARTISGPHVTDSYGYTGSFIGSSYTRLGY